MQKKMKTIKVPEFIRCKTFGLTQRLYNLKKKRGIFLSAPKNVDSFKSNGLFFAKLQTSDKGTLAEKKQKQASLKPFIKTQCGRTMLESLMALLIIGMISIGAVYGLRYGFDIMRAYRAQTQVTQIARGVESLYAWNENYARISMSGSHGICANDILKQKCDANNLYVNPWGGSIKVTRGDTLHGYKIVYTQVSRRVCQMLSGMHWEKVIMLNKDCAHDEQTVYFSNEGDATICEPSCMGKQYCQGAVCVCANGGEGENCEITDKCLSLDCSGECLNGCQNNACVIVPDGTPCSVGLCQNGACTPCAALYPDRPYYDESRHICVQCLTHADCPTDMPLCNPSNVCSVCPAGKPLWNGNACVECLTHEDCNGTTPVCNASSHVCEPCPSEYPLWDATRGQCIACDSSAPFWSDKLGKCVECLANSDCTNAQKPLCDTDEGVCKACADNLYFDGENCVACRYDGEVYDKTRNKCVIKLNTMSYSRDYGSNVGRRWMVNYGFGPYGTDYEVWVEGYADDELYLDINRTLSYCHWSDNKSCSESDKKDPWKIGDLFDFASGGYIASTVRNPNGMAKMGVLKKGDFGAVHVGSNTGWLEWRRTDGGKGPRIWLERSVDMK